MDTCAIRSSRHVAVLTFLGVMLSLLLVARRADARLAGIDSTQFLGRNPPSCNACHSGGTAPTNMVTLTPSATNLTSGQQITLTFTVATINGTPGAAGFNLRSSQQGTFAVGGSDAASTRVLAGTNGWSEATHSAPKRGEPTTFTVLWTPNPAASGSVTFTAWGNSVNENGAPTGDAAASTTAVVTITPICSPVTWYRDVDGDGYGNAGDSTSSCAQPAGYVSNNGDCNDGSAAIHPGAAEACNGIDDNCAGGIDEGLPTSVFYFDGDGDGYGKPDGTKVACSLALAGPGYVANNADCDDASMAVHPGAAETCNGIDDNCASGVDDGLPTSTFYFDADHDGFGNPAVTKVACNLAQAGAGYVTDNTDCNDGSAAIHPGATEVCNGADDDCNGTPDNGLAMTTFYRDADGDGFGDAASSKTACSMAVAGAGYVIDHTDCNDADKNVFPNAPEICGNGKDDNCNGVTDTDAPTNSTFYRDVDGDGYGSATSGTTMACAPPAGYVSNNTDCNDGNVAIHPGATEVCNGKDDNCANGADEGLGTISCGEGPCRTTVDACVGGTPQVCTPMCPDAGADARVDAETRDASTSDTGFAPDAGPRDVGALDVANPIDVGSTADARSDASADAPSETSTPPAAPPDARADAASRDSGTDAVVKDAASMPGANEGIEGSTDSGCNCRAVSTTTSGSRWAWGGATLVLLGLVRRRRSALGKRRGA
jgi:MYXO-CTERM domain-containing protein